MHSGYILKFQPLILASTSLYLASASGVPVESLLGVASVLTV